LIEQEDKKKVDNNAQSDSVSSSTFQLSVELETKKRKYQAYMNGITPMVAKGLSD